MKRKQNNERAHRKRLRNEERLKLGRQQLAAICKKNALLSHDGIAVTGPDPTPPPQNPISLSGAVSGFSAFAVGGWFQRANADGLIGGNGQGNYPIRVTPWCNVAYRDVRSLLNQKWRPNQKKSPLWLLAECAP